MTRTDDVLTAIDHTVEDWETSGDAMRWTPEPPEPARKHPPELSDEDRERLRLLCQRVADEYTTVLKTAARALEPLLDRVREAVRTVPSDWVLVPPPRPTTREEILAWRQRRSCHAFSRQPQREPRRNHRAGPDPRRLSVHHTPQRAGRRP